MTVDWLRDKMQRRCGMQGRQASTSPFQLAVVHCLICWQGSDTPGPLWLTTATTRWLANAEKVSHYKGGRGNGCPPFASERQGRERDVHAQGIKVKATSGDEGQSLGE